MPTPEELQKKLDDAIASIAKLEAKNRELADEKKASKAEAEAAREAAEAAAEEKARTSKDVEALEKSLTKKFEKQIADLTAANAKKDATLETLLIDNAIQAGLVEHGIAPAYHKAVTAMLKADAKLEGNEAKIGDVGLVEHLKSFVASDEGKAFVAAPANTGANATGSKAQGSKLTKENFTLDAVLELAKTNPAQAKAEAEAAGFTGLFE